MGITDFFKKKGKKKIDPIEAKKQAEKMLGGKMPEITDAMIDQMLDGSMPGVPKLGPMQKMAIRGLKKMSPEKRQEVFAEAFGKMGGADGESKEEMAKQIEEMRVAGQLNSKQYKIAKKRLGIK
jgi:hypothetical protein